MKSYCKKEKPQLHRQKKKSYPVPDPRGKYVLKLFVHNEWRAVTIDDRVFFAVFFFSLTKEFFVLLGYVVFFFIVSQIYVFCKIIYKFI